MNKSGLPVLCVLFTTMIAGPRCMAQQFACVTSYSCSPTSCYQTMTGTGFFSVHMQGTAQFNDCAGMQLLRKGKKIGVDSVGCTISIKLEAFVDTDAYDPTYGYGISVEGDAYQGFTLLLLGGFDVFNSTAKQFGGTEQRCG